MGQGLLDGGGAEGVVAGGENAMLFSDRGNGREVHHLEHRVGWGFHPNQRRLRIDGFGDLVGVARINEFKSESGGTGPHLAEETMGATVQVV